MAGYAIGPVLVALGPYVIYEAPGGGFCLTDERYIANGVTEYRYGCSPSLKEVASLAMRHFTEWAGSVRAGHERAIPVVGEFANAREGWPIPDIYLDPVDDDDDDDDDPDWFA